VTALNEAVQGSAVRVLRPWNQRLEPPLPALDSNEDDPELLIHIPFDGTVKLKARLLPGAGGHTRVCGGRAEQRRPQALCIIGGADGAAPAELRAFTNRDDLDFAAVAELAPAQRWELQENRAGELEYPTQCARLSPRSPVLVQLRPARAGRAHLVRRVTKFSGVHSLDLHIPANFGASRTRIHFIGLKGEFAEVRHCAAARSPGLPGAKKPAPCGAAGAARSGGGGVRDAGDAGRVQAPCLQPGLGCGLSGDRAL